MSASESLAVDDGSLWPAPPPDAASRMQRVVVRMLFDPEFVESVHADPEGALAEDDVPPALVRQLIANDRRLWNADRLRRRRALKVLLEEFPTASALVLERWGRMARLEAFFSSAAFHRAVRERGYMALAFHAWLAAAIGAEEAHGGEGGRALLAVLALEGAMVLARRHWKEARRGRDPGLRALAGDEGTDADRLVLSAGCLGVRVPRGTLGIVQHVQKWSFEVGLVPALVLCEDAPTPSPLPPLGDDHEHYLIECDETGQARLSDVERVWADVLMACRTPVDRSLLAARTRTRGPAAAKAWERAEGLLEAGVLREVRLEDGGRIVPRESAS